MILFKDPDMVHAVQATFKKEKKNKQVYLSFSLEVTVGIKLKSKRCTVLTIFLIGPVISAANISSFFSIDLDNCSH